MIIRYGFNGFFRGREYPYVEEVRYPIRPDANVLPRSHGGRVVGGAVTYPYDVEAYSDSPSPPRSPIRPSPSPPLAVARPQSRVPAQLPPISAAPQQYNSPVQTQGRPMQSGRQVQRFTSPGVRETVYSDPTRERSREGNVEKELRDVAKAKGASFVALGVVLLLIVVQIILSSVWFNPYNKNRPVNLSDKGGWKAQNSLLRTISLPIVFLCVCAAVGHVASWTPSRQRLMLPFAVLLFVASIPLITVTVLDSLDVSAAIDKYCQDKGVCDAAPFIATLVFDCLIALFMWIGVGCLVTLNNELYDVRTATVEREGQRRRERDRALLAREEKLRLGAIDTWWEPGTGNYVVECDVPGFERDSSNLEYQILFAPPLETPAPPAPPPDEIPEEAARREAEERQRQRDKLDHRVMLHVWGARDITRADPGRVERNHDFDRMIELPPTVSDMDTGRCGLFNGVATLVFTCSLIQERRGTFL